MLLKFNKKDFMTALKQGSMCAGQNSTLPILDYIRMKGNGDQTVRIVSSSLDVTVERACKTEEPMDEPFDICIPAKDLSGAVSRLSDYVFSIEIGDDNIRVIYGSGSISMPKVPSYEWPDTFSQDQPQLASFKVDTKTVAYIIGTCNGFIGNDELRPNMMTVFVKSSGGDLEYCATDAHKIVTENIAGAVKDLDEDTEFMIPKRTMPALRALCEESDRPLSVFVLERNVVMGCEDWSVAFTKQEGKYPNYKAVIAGPLTNEKQFTLNKSNFAGAVTRMLAAANTNTNAIRVECGDGRVNLYSEDIDFGKAAKETIEASDNGCEPVTFGLNGVFMKMCIDLVESENVTVTAKNPGNAVTFIDGKHPGKVILLMPLRLNE